MVSAMRPPAKILLALLAAMLAVTSLHAGSFYTTKLDDPQAVYLTPDKFPVKGDGVADDSDAVQAAIDKVQETTVNGILFIPEGTYRLTKTIHVWAGIRLIGYGANRPKFVLAPNTPGFQEYKKYDPEVEGTGNYMFHFTTGRPKEGQPIRDANPGTFYSAMSNIDIEIGEGNPAAIGVRFHIAQHCYLAHMDFHIGSGKAGVDEIGNELDDCHFFGGEYGIMTGKCAPSWPVVIIDSSFEGQRKAAIDTEEAGLTLIHDIIKNQDTGIHVRPDRTDIIWVTDSLFQDVAGPALVLGQENNARSQTNLNHVVFRRTPVVAEFPESGKKIYGQAYYELMISFCHGLQIHDGDLPTTPTTYRRGPNALSGMEDYEDMTSQYANPSIPSLPSCDTWVNLRDLGAKGDGKTDDTKAIQDAINAHRAIYIPSGRYVVTDTITLKSDTVLVGLNPITTQIDLPDGTPAFADEGKAKPLIEAPKGGVCTITGIGIDAGGNNPSAIGLLWKAGGHSLVNDVRFLEGHGTFNADGSHVNPYNSNHTGDPDPKRRWDSQYPSLWITDGGGGIFKDIWTPDTFAQAGVYVSDTKTPGRMYAISIEHHVRNEVKIKNVSNWGFYAMQTEEERGEGPRCLPYDIQDCSDLTFANVYLYRVTTDYAFPYGVKVVNSSNIVFHGLHAYSPGKTTYDSTVFDQTHNIEYRSREIAVLSITGKAPAKREASKAPELAPGAKVEKCIGGFENIDGAATDVAGDVWFVDPRPQRIYRWSTEKNDLSLMRDSAISPHVLAFDKKGNLLIVSRAGIVYSWAVNQGGEDITALNLESSAGTGALSLYAVNRWRDEHDFLDYTLRAMPEHYVSPDGSVVIPNDEDFRAVHRVQKADAGPRPARRRVRSETVDLLRAYQLVPAVPGQPLYLADEFGQRTWKFTVGADGKLSDPKLFAEEGEAGIAVDEAGNVYVAAGNIFVYNSKGEKIDTILVPERPASLVFGGKDRKTLFITARTSLYSVRTKSPGR